MLGIASITNALPIAQSSSTTTTAATVTIFKTFGLTACQWGGDPINQDRIRTYKNGTLTLNDSNQDTINAPNTEKLNFSISSSGVITQKFQDGTTGTLTLALNKNLLYITKDSATTTGTTGTTAVSSTSNKWTFNSNHELGIAGTSVILSACSDYVGNIKGIYLNTKSKTATCPKGQFAIAGPTLQQITVGDGPGTGVCVDQGHS